MKGARLLAHHYNNEDVTGWYMSRKLNGFRCFSKSDNCGKVYLETLGRYSGPKEIHAPSWFLEQIKPEWDGELWHPTDCLQTVKSICGQGREKSLIDPRWNEIVYMVFDTCDNRVWSQRQSSLAIDFYRRKGTNVALVEQKKILFKSDIKEYMHSLGNVEGIMLSNPNGYRTSGRSHDLLKVKAYYETEATVIGVSPGMGKHYNRMGALLCKLTWDDKVSSVYGGSRYMSGSTVTFNVGGGFSDTERGQDWPMGTIINFSYLGVTPNGTPVSPNFLKRV